MLNRLKSLPLTIILTLLIWMYAESQVRTAPGEESFTLNGLPVLAVDRWGFLKDYNIELRPDHVSITVSGPRDRIALLRDSMAQAHEDNPAYLILTPDDARNRQPGGTERRVAFIPGVNGLTVTELPEVNFRLIDKNKPAQTAP